MSGPKRWRVAGINFDHMHMGDLLRMVAEHPAAEVVAVCDTDPHRMEEAVEALGLPADRLFTRHDECLERTQPDAVILCPATSEHADWVERVAPYGVPILLEKPFAASLADADRMLTAMAQTNQPLAINWPLRWYPSHATAKRLLDDGSIGEVLEVHYYGGNRGPLFHGAGKVERTPTIEEKRRSWWYRQDKGGGSLLDYLGYGVTLGTWFHNGARPSEVSCITAGAPSLEVDEHSLTVARYAKGLSKFETRWGTFTDPWTHQPQPKCGFVIVGSEGTLSSYDLERSVRLQTLERPEGFEVAAEPLRFPTSNPVEYFLDCLEHERPVEGPLDPAICRIGQQIVDTAVLSARDKRSLPLLETPASA